MGFPGRSRFFPGECPVGYTGPRHVEPHRGGGGALLSAEHPLLCLSHHPSSLPYILTFVGTELTETSSQGNEGRRLNQEVGCARAIIQRCLLTACLLR